MAKKQELDFEQWFKKRNLSIFDYQKQILLKDIKQLYTNTKPTVLALSAGGGKTLMSIYEIEQFIKNNPGEKVLVLAHGTNVLRSQYAEELELFKPNFKFKKIDSPSELKSSYNDYDVFVTLPHTLHRLKTLPKFKLLIVDEAHQFYFQKLKNKEGMVQQIIKKIKPSYQLLLTGTPSPFVLKNYPIIVVSTNEIIDTGIIEDTLVEIATSTYDIKSSDYNVDHNLKISVRLTKKQTEDSLWIFLQQLVERLQHAYRNEPEKYAKWKFSDNWSWNKLKGDLSNIISAKKIGKIMIACNNQTQAKYVSDFFKNNNINTALSISDVDYNSDEIKRFKSDPNCNVLVVVYRGILGFNMKELEVVLDMTASENIDRIFQLMARVLRTHPNGNKKIFFKIAPKGLEEYFEFIMSAVLCLTDKEYLLKYNGKNFLDLNIPITKIKNPKTNKSSNNKQTKQDRKKQIKNIEYIGLPAIRFFKDVIHKNNDIFSSYAYIKMKEIRNIFLLDNDRMIWTKEAIFASAAGELA